MSDAANITSWEQVETGTRLLALSRRGLTINGRAAEIHVDEKGPFGYVKFYCAFDNGWINDEFFNEWEVLAILPPCHFENMASAQTATAASSMCNAITALAESAS